MPTGTPATYGAPPSLPQVTTVSPLAGTTESSTSSRSSRPPLAEVAAAVQEADLHALADPAADDRLGVDDEQHGGGGAGDPQHPADQAVVVDHGHVGAACRRAEPASMVTVRENDCAGPMPTTRAGTSA